MIFVNISRFIFSQNFATPNNYIKEKFFKQEMYIKEMLLGGDLREKNTGKV